MKIFDMKNIDGSKVAFLFINIYVLYDWTDPMLSLFWNLHFSHRLTQYPECATKAGKNTFPEYYYCIEGFFQHMIWSKKKYDWTIKPW